MSLYLFSLTVLIFVFILIRRNRERALWNKIEMIAKLGRAKKLVVTSGLFIPARLVKLVLWPEPAKEEREKPTELKVAWQSESPEMIEFQVSPHHKISFPRYIPMEALGKMEWHEFRPIVAEHEGTWFLAIAEEEVTEKGRAKKVKRVLSTRDFLVTGELIGVIAKKVRMGDDEEHRYYAPAKGYVISFQVSHGTQVKPGDVLVVMALPTGRLINENSN